MLRDDLLVLHLAFVLVLKTVEMMVCLLET